MVNIMNRIFLLLLVLTLPIGLNAEELPKIRLAPSFELTDTEGESYAFSPKNNVIQVVNFFFARCPSICPKINRKMKEIFLSLPSGKKVVFHSISVDPEHDTPKILADYAKKYRETDSEKSKNKKAQNQDKKWKFLTGDIDVISELLEKGFSLGSGSLPDEHNTRIVLVGSEGYIRGFYQGMDKEALKRFESDLSHLLQSVSLAAIVN